VSNQKNNHEQLKPFPKGVSGNPKGRPVGAISITSAVKRRLAEEAGGDKTKLDELVDVLMEKAKEDKDYSTLKTIWNYIDGLPKGTDPFGGKGGTMTINWATNGEQDDNDTIHTEKVGETDAPNDKKVDSPSATPESGKDNSSGESPTTVSFNDSKE